MLKNLRMTVTRLICSAAVLMVAGCSDAQKQEWNEFWGVSEPKKQREAGSTPKRKSTASAQRQTASAKRSAPPSRPAATAKSNKPAERSSRRERSNDVDQDVNDYSARMKPVKGTEYQPNDNTSKINRQQDPNRQKRIHHVAHTDQQDEPVSGSTSGGDALERYERNTGVPAEAEVEGIEEPEAEPVSESEPADSAASRNFSSLDESVSSETETSASDSDRVDSSGAAISGDEPQASAMDQSAEESASEEIEPGRIDGDRTPAGRSSNRRDDIVPESSHSAAEAPAVMQDREPGNALFSPAGETSADANRNLRPLDSPSTDEGETSKQPSLTGEQSPLKDPQKPADSTAYQTGSPASDAGSSVAELEEISISPAPEAATEAKSPVDDSPAVSANTDASLTNSAVSYEKLIADQEITVAADPSDLEQQYRLRMMYLVDGRDDKARENIPGLDADLQRIISAQIDSLISARSTSGRDPATWATRQLESLESLRRLVKERADLVVPRVVLCTEVEGFGRYKPIEPAEFKAGRRNRVLIYSEVDNFTTKQTNSGMYRTLLSTRQTLMTKDGKEIWSEKSENIEDLARGPRRDFFLSTLPITIPKSLPPGDYVLKVEIEDVLAGKINSNSTGFKIVP